MKRVLGIDPGVSATGLVLVHEGCIVEAACPKTKPRYQSDFTALMLRVVEITDEIMRCVRRWGPDVIAIESFEDFGAHLRGARMRYYAPALIGYLHGRLEGPIIYQSPKIKTEYADLMRLWQLGIASIPGDELLTNAHLKDAAIHALYLEAQYQRSGRRLGRTGG